MRAEAAARVKHEQLSPIGVATPAGSLNSVLAEAVWRPFTQLTHHPIRAVRWSDDVVLEGSLASDLKWSLALVQDDAAQAGCEKKLFVPIVAEDRKAGDPEACGTPALSLDFALAWDSARFSGQPNWSEFWDVARHPGKRGLRADPRGTLEIALLSDGVPPAAVYGMLSTPEGLDHAFRRLSQIRPYVVWWTSPDEAMNILKNGAALMGFAPTNEVQAANAQLPAPRFRILWAPVFRINYDWVIPVGETTDLTVAHALLTWASASEQQNALNGRLISGPPTTGPDAVAVSMRQLPVFRLNATFWRQHFPAIRTRFDQWLAQH